MAALTCWKSKCTLKESMTQRRCWCCCGFVVLFRFEVEYARRVIGLFVFVYVVYERNVKAVVHEIFAAEGQALEGQRPVVDAENSRARRLKSLQASRPRV